MDRMKISAATMIKQIRQYAPQIDKELCYCEDAYGEPGIGIMTQCKLMHPCGVAMIFNNPVWIMKPERDHPIHFVNLNRLKPWEMRTFHKQVVEHRRKKKEAHESAKIEPFYHELAMELQKEGRGHSLQVSVPNGVDDPS